MSPRRIKDRFSKVEDRRERYRLRKLKAGLCRNDGKPRDVLSGVFCTQCLEKHRQQVQRWRQEFSHLTKPVPTKNAQT